MYMVNAYDILSNNTILLQRCSKRGYKMIIFQNKKNQFQIQSRKFKWSKIQLLTILYMCCQAIYQWIHLHGPSYA